MLPKDKADLESKKFRSKEKRFRSHMLSIPENRHSRVRAETERTSGTNDRGVAERHENWSSASEHTANALGQFPVEKSSKFYL